MKKLCTWDCSAIPFNKNLTDLYASKVADDSPMSNFLAIINRTGNTEEHINVIRKSYFFAGIIYIKENLELLELITNTDLAYESRLNDELSQLELEENKTN